MLQWKSNRYYKFLRVYVRVRTCVCVCVHGSVRVLALVQPYLSRLPHEGVILTSAASLAPPQFSILFHKWHDFREKLLNIKCVFIFSTNLFEIFLIPQRIQRDIVIRVKTSLCKVPFILVGF
jgi:hypothetical protein